MGAHVDKALMPTWNARLVAKRTYRKKYIFVGRLLQIIFMFDACRVCGAHRKCNRWRCYSCDIPSIVESLMKECIVVCSGHILTDI
jgi:hypothetical protein